MTRPELEHAIRSLWDYLAVRDEPEPADAAFVFGRDDFRIPERALQLYRSGCAPVLLLLGGRGRLSGNLTTAESEAFKAYLLERGVPCPALRTESVSTHTGQNVDEGLRLLRENALRVQRLILVTHGPHARRTLATARLRCPAVRLISCPDDCALPPSETPARTEAVRELIGELERLQEYARRGYIAADPVPPEILQYQHSAQKWLARE